MRACFAQVMSDPDCGGKFFFMNYPKNTECACCTNKTDKLPADQIRRTGNNNNIYRITYGRSEPKPEPKQQYEQVHEGRFCSRNDGNYHGKFKHNGGEDYKRACFNHVMNDKDCGGKFFFMNWPKNSECACCKNTTDKLPAGEIRRTGNNNNIYRIISGGEKPEP